MKVVLDLSNEEVFRELISSYCKEKGWNNIHYDYDVGLINDKKFIGEINITIKNCEK